MRFVICILIIVLISYSAAAVESSIKRPDEIKGSLGGFNWDFKYEKGQCKIVDKKRVCIWGGKVVPSKPRYEDFGAWGRTRAIERPEQEQYRDTLMKGNFSGWRTRVG